MSKIKVLDKALAELIAAGEVVERPASIAKELIENAVDAGATSVTVEIEGGGTALLRASDNGSGIARDEIPTAFLRHATSKIATPDDLEAILTLGFRGEALASVAAMAKVEMLSKTAQESEGTLFRIEGGHALEMIPAGCPNGTIVTVRDVFYNTPARMKFLKKDVGEGNAVAGMVDKCALAYPNVAFKFIRDGKLRLQTSGGGELLPVIRAVYGKELAAVMCAVEHEIPQEGVRVKGYVTSPQGAKSSRIYQNFFLNSRYVRTRTGAAALEEAFKTYIGPGKYPGCVLHIGITPSLVDVNVHPAKIEVRFANEKPVFHCVYFAVRNALSPGSVQDKYEQPSQIWQGEPLRGKVYNSSPGATQGRMNASQFKALYTPRGNWGQESIFNKPLSMNAPSLDISVDLNEENPAHPVKKISPAPLYDKIFTPSQDIISRENASIEQKNDTNVTDMDIVHPDPPQQNTVFERPYSSNTQRIIGELAGVYILLEHAGNLVIVDKHAAHERIIYERLKKDLSYGNRQLLLSPLTLTLSREDHEALTENPQQLEELGFMLEDFGGTSLLVREIPIEMGERDIAFILEDVAGKLRTGNHDLTPDVMDRLYFSIACKGAFRAKDKNTLPELEAIAQMLRESPGIIRCPHGRPVQATLSANEIEKLFGRQG